MRGFSQKLKPLSKVGVTFLAILAILLQPIVALNIPSVFAAGPSLTVCANTNECDYMTIQSAVNGADAGAVILVKNGTYTESVNITKPLTLEAESTGTRIIGGPSYNDAAFKVAASNITIEGFSIGDPSLMLATVGVELGNSVGAVIKNNVIEHNQRGISLASASNVVISGNTIRDNNADPENNAGIWGDAVNGITISDSSFSGATNTSINLAGSTNIVIKNNTFTSGGNAAVIWNDSNVTLLGNDVSGLMSTGFYITGTSNITATGNKFSATTTGKSAFSISTDSGNSSSNISLSENNITGYTNGINVGSGATSDRVNASLNWWGDASGPTDTVTTDGSTPASNPTGTGTVAKGNVRYTGWCTNAGCTTNSNTPPAEQNTIVRPNAMQGWAKGDTRPGGTYSFVADSTSPYPSGVLQLRTDNTKEAKSQIYRTADVRLDQLLELSYKTKQLAANIGDGDASLQLSVYLDGTNSSSYTNLVYEPYWNGSVQPNTWQSWNVFSGKFWSSRSYSSLQAGAGGAPFYTIDDILRDYPNAKIVAYIVNAGTNNPGYQINVDGVHIATRASNVTYDFEQNLPLGAPTNLTPPNGSLTNDRGFSMTWSTVTDAAGYQYRTSNTKNGNELGAIVYCDGSVAASDGCNGATYHLVPGNYSTSDDTVTRGNSGTPDGDYYWQVRAIDADGNTGPWSVISKVTVDATAPEKPIHQSPANGAFINRNNFWFEWSDVNGAVSYEAQFSQSNSKDGNGSLNVEVWSGDANHNQPTEPRAWSSGANGTWYWQVRAVDAAGNKSAWTIPWELTIDMSAPALTVSAPVNNSLYGGLETHSLQKKTISVSANASDENGLGAYCVKLTKVGKSEGSCVSSGYFYAPANGAMPTVNIDTTSLSSGSYVVKARITDKANNVTELTRTIVVDNTKPVITTTLSNGAIMRSAVGITLNATEEHPQIYNIRILDSSEKVVGGLYDANASADSIILNWDTTVVSDGTYKIQFSARDTVGNSAATFFRTITVDNTAPVVTVAPIDLSTNKRPAIKGTTSEGGGNVDLWLDGSKVATVTSEANGTWTWTSPTDLTVEEHTIVAIATDAAGNTSANDTSAVHDYWKHFTILSTTPLTPAPSGGPSIPSPSSTPGAATLTVSETDSTEGQVLAAEDTKANTTAASDNTATDTKDDDSANVGKVLGLKWYWWLVIILVAAGLWWLLAARRGRKEDETL